MRPILKSLELYTLLALAQQPLHGYGLATQIESDSDGKLKPLPGNLYVVLRRLEQGGMVRRVSDGDGDSSRRREYELTDSGRQRLAAEARRLAGFARAVELRFSPGDKQG